MIRVTFTREFSIDVDSSCFSDVEEAVKLLTESEISEMEPMEGWDWGAVHSKGRSSSCDLYVLEDGKLVLRQERDG